MVEVFNQCSLSATWACHWPGAWATARPQRACTAATQSNWATNCRKAEHNWPARTTAGPSQQPSQLSIDGVCRLGPIGSGPTAGDGQAFPAWQPESDRRDFSGDRQDRQRSDPPAAPRLDRTANQPKDQHAAGPQGGKWPIQLFASCRHTVQSRPGIVTMRNPPAGRVLFRPALLPIRPPD